MIIESRFKPAWWLGNAHGQTIYPAITRSIQIVADSTEHIELADGDFLELSWMTKGLPANTPVIILPGLGVNLNAAYAAGLMRAFNKAGWRAVMMHFRGGGNQPNRLPKVYHLGDTSDFACCINILAEREPHTLKAAVGVSLAGNVLLKYLGETGSQDLLKAAVAVSVPFKLTLVAEKVNKGFCRIYQTYLLKKWKRMMHRKKEVYAKNWKDMSNRLDKSRCFLSFDENITAPLNGFSSACEYYEKASSLPYLSSIKTDTLIIHAKDDPFMTPDGLPAVEQLSDKVTLELSEKGGHAGFISGHLPGLPVYWLEKRIPEYIRSVFSNKS
ncbi:alpha/beta hydrolase [Legionella birminghamensis]|uniref:Alpha/beta hydrolase n=1 Tax=Legionella birminghamensis TaxID=28083 RepID=A0A378ICB1_9GAMM|nr:hydrolase [Legionella birminghamensis]KTC71768.1 alpha/beta hydrolase [Legionella birminghamensis]STX32395.1 hydrolase of the alpha/beta-hydrolase fold family [Legionella birminghamensis]